MISRYKELAIENAAFNEKRSRQNSEWMNKLVHEMLELRLKQNPKVQNLIPQLQGDVIDNVTTP